LKATRTISPSPERVGFVVGFEVTLVDAAAICHSPPTTIFVTLLPPVVAAELSAVQLVCAGVTAVAFSPATPRTAKCSTLERLEQVSDPPVVADVVA
jgi:hypothetical protein